MSETVTSWDTQILDERAALYSRLEEAPALPESRCLEVVLGDRHWLFPETEIALLLPGGRITQLPAGAHWDVWPCCGLIGHAMSTLPLLCWGTLAGQGELAVTTQGTPSGPEHAVLVLRACPVALRVPGPVEMAHVNLQDPYPDDHPWSAGKLANGASIADLGRLRGGGS